MKKRIITFGLVALMLIFPINGVFAVEASVDKQEIPEIEFIFESDVSEEMKQWTIAHLSGAEVNPQISTYSILCLFGHKKTTTNTTVITHRASASAPRCLQQRYTIEKCSRCDYSKTTLLASTYVQCCS